MTNAIAATYRAQIISEVANQIFGSDISGLRGFINQVHQIEGHQRGYTVMDMARDSNTRLYEQALRILTAEGKKRKAFQPA